MATALKRKTRITRPAKVTKTRPMALTSARTLDTADWEVPEFTAKAFFAKKNRYALVIPVLNEGERIKKQLEKMRPFMKMVDVILVDGGSNDGSVSPEALKKTGVRAVLVKTGAGKLSAQLRVGFAWLLKEGYEGAVTIDGNNKDNPITIPLFLQALDAGIDHVQGSRFLPGGFEKNTPASRKWGIKLLHAPLLSLAAGVRWTDTTNGFKAYSRRFLLDPFLKPFRNCFDTYELYSYLNVRAGQLGFSVLEVPVERVYPSSGMVPTKISKWRGSFLMLGILFKACLHWWDPSEKKT